MIRKAMILAVLAATFIGLFSTPVFAMPAPDGNSVAILKSTTGFADPSLEKSKAIAQGLTVVEMSDAVWMATTTAEFATYKAIIIGDPTCQGFGYLGWTVAEGSRAVWGPAITGNVVVVGTDPTFHSLFAFGGLPGPDGDQVADSGIAFAAAAPGKTGAYITTSCVYHGTAPGTPVPLLDVFGAFTALGVGCYNDSHIVAVHPALAGLTDASLSGWSCSVHNAFDSIDPTFLPLAIAENIGGAGSLVFADGTYGVPYIIARGEELSPILCGNGIQEATEECDDGNTANGDGCSAQCKLEPCGNGTVDPGEECDDGNLVSGDGCSATCKLECGDGVTNPAAGEECDDGNVIDGDGCSSTCQLENEPPDCSMAMISPAVIWPPNHKMVPLAISGVTDPDGDPVVVVVTGIMQDEPTNTVGDGNTETDGAIDASGMASVRAERTGTPKVPGNGRVYHVSYTADDGNGGTCTGTLLVCVPHDMGMNSVCVDEGPLHDSLMP